ncbi:5-formyltetrahydrofolate cyclo-ligase [Sphingomonas vulcanisoli]|uniref:5-formyltetrahydrofolate cyclo-ligase n=2 Tax=Sphingomonas vulcanisoli TaxID=1658060 RepID=A0ABX0TTQ3_9SPHN|nr:5-formyltetrahydrofolate cyclo-ligase [Sphingomonas vulcanisoli]
MLRARRAALFEGLGEQSALREAEATADRLLPHIPPQAIVALYFKIQDEIDPQPLIERLHARGQRLALPHLTDRTTMYFRAWAPGDPLQRAVFKLRQPLATAAEVAPDIIVTPLLGFDRQGGRIGQGASHYDRAFSRFPGARRLGYAWSVQEVEAVPHDPWDIPLHAIATEREWIVVPAQ